ncbi:MAG: PEP-CTERM sorting domain-containing protein, partial [Kiritimatiellae bacterium]|nr:PEP-CTERM sorting domain-containing protein [Kiritimatiellia bacterium]
VYVDAQALFAGNWTTRHWVEFDFWAEDVVPGAVQLRWAAATNENYWSYNLMVTATQTWTHLKATFDDWEAWMYPGATEDQFLADLAAIDWIGVYVLRNSDIEQSYGIDDFTLVVPEPSQWAMLAAALTGSGLSLLRRRRGAGKVGSR